ncbi:IS3 family transposase [Streptomyces sp. NPDC007369]|uniref:IS3 family transposase n=1 Tax=Streptomyces sp. NPDC007369 TaxID=3154589 RepID=UPI0034114FC2
MSHRRRRRPGGCSSGCCTERRPERRPKRTLRLRSRYRLRRSPGRARWCGDITYIPTGQAWLYLATVIDISSRKVIGWATADHLGTSLAADALKAACRQRRPQDPVIFHSDRGMQYTSRDFACLAAAWNIRLSVGRTGVCRDNALAESFFATLKNELVSRHAWDTHTAARSAIFEYIEGWYNTRRLHSSLGCQTPALYENSAA